MPLLHRSPPTGTPPFPAGDESDVALVLAAQRDPHAFAPLFSRYWDVVLRYCRFRLVDRQEAEDAARTNATSLSSSAGKGGAPVGGERCRSGMVASWGERSPALDNTAAAECVTRGGEL